MEQTVQTQEPQPTQPQKTSNFPGSQISSKPAKPTSIKILQWVLFILGVLVAIIKIEWWLLGRYPGYEISASLNERLSIILFFLIPLTLALALFKYWGKNWLISLISTIAGISFLGIIILGVMGSFFCKDTSGIFGTFVWFVLDKFTPFYYIDFFPGIE